MYYYSDSINILNKAYEIFIKDENKKLTNQLKKKYEDVEELEYLLEQIKKKYIDTSEQNNFIEKIINDNSFKSKNIILPLFEEIKRVKNKEDRMAKIDDFLTNNCELTLQFYINRHYFLTFADDFKDYLNVG